MKKIGLISDTHHTIHPRLFDFFKEVDEIWHAGDIGSLKILDKLNKFKPVRAVYGNIDGQEIRREYPEFQIFNCEDVKVFMTHIGGYPNRYAKGIKALLQEHNPNLFITGHSHILKVINDCKLNILHMNPGAAGNSGFHRHITMLRFIIDGNNIKNLEVLEIERKH